MAHSDSVKTFQWASASLWSRSTNNLKFQLVVATTLLFVAKAFSVSFFVALKSFADLSTGSESVNALSAFKFGLLLAGCKFAESVCNSVRESLLVKPMLTAIRGQLFNAHRAALSWSMTRHLNGDGRMLPITLVRGARELYMYYHLVLQQLLPLILDVLIACCLLAYVMSWREGVLIFLAMCFYAYASRRLVEWRMPIRRQLEKTDIHREILAKDTYSNIQIVKTFGRQTLELLRFDKASLEYTHHGCRSQHSLSIMLIVQAVMFATTLVSIFAVSYYFESSALTIGAVILSVTMLYQLFVPLNGLGTMYRELRNSEVSLKPLMDLISSDASDFKEVPLARLTPASLECSNLTVTADKRSILDDVTFDVRPGSRIAVVGPSGSGKSTLLKCIAGLQTYETGQLLIDKADALPSIQGRFPDVLYVPQDATIFSRNLSSNLLVDDSDESLSRAKAVLETLGIGEVVQRNNPDEQEFGHAFSLASGGERQRLAVARGLLQRVGMVIFDEPTSSLDQRAEQSVFDAILSLPDTTVLVSTHSVDYLEHFEKVLFILEGRVLGFDTHERLLNQLPSYFDFIQSDRVST